MIEEKGKEVVEQMARYAQEQAEREAEESRIRRETEFSKLAENLHHLTSTAHIRGVYNPVIDYVDVIYNNHDDYIRILIYIFFTDAHHESFTGGEPHSRSSEGLAAN